MKYCITFFQYDGKAKPLTLAKVVPSLDKLKFLLGVMEDSPDTFELLSVVPVKEVNA